MRMNTRKGGGRDLTHERPRTLSSRGTSGRHLSPTALPAVSRLPTECGCPAHPWNRSPPPPGARSARQLAPTPRRQTQATAPPQTRTAHPPPPVRTVMQPPVHVGQQLLVLREPPTQPPPQRVLPSRPKLPDGGGRHPWERRGRLEWERERQRAVHHHIEPCRRTQATWRIASS